MSSLALPAEALIGAYPERLEDAPSALDQLAARALAPLLRRRAARHRWAGFPTLVGRHGRELLGPSDADLLATAQAVGAQLRLGGYEEELVARAFALVREVA